MSKQDNVKKATECLETPLKNVPPHSETNNCFAMKLNWLVSTRNKSSSKVISEQTII